MKQLVLMFELMRADFRERIRRTSFLVTVLVAISLGYFYLPDISSGYVTLSVGGTRGQYNSAWVGTVASLLSSTFLSIIGFYLVKNALERDRRTGVGQILAATPLTRFKYLLSKALSNFAVLAALQGAVVVAVTAMQLLRGEDRNLQFVDLVAPSLFMVLPFLAMVASAAVFFESVRPLRGALGNVVFYILWIAVLVTSFDPDLKSNERGVEAYNDVAGVSQLMGSITEYAYKTAGLENPNVNLGVNIDPDNPVTASLTWPGMNWTTGIIVGRLLWFLAAIGLVGLAVPFFDRFGAIDLMKKSGKQPDHAAPITVAEVSHAPTVTRLSALQAPLRPSLFALIGAELTLMRRSIGWWWFLVAAGLNIAMFFAPMTASRLWLWPLAWIWPLAMWSSLGNRERRFGTEQLLYSVSGAFWQRLFAIWFAGVVIAMLCGGGMAVRFLLAGDGAGFAQWKVGALFIPTLALTCGVWTCGTRLFEGLYITLWYVGPMNRAEPFDYMGIRPESFSVGVTLVYALLIPALMALALLGRKRQMSQT